MKYFFISLLFLAFSMGSFGDSTTKSSTNITPTIWHGLYIYYYNQAKELSKKEHKPVLLYFYGNDCTYCDLFDQYVLQKPDVVNFVNKHFIFSSVNVDDAGGNKFIRKFRLFGTPAFAVIYPNGHFKVYQGYKTKEQFIYILSKLDR
ncbi:thioredoxin family protein [Hydrogenobaculum acidophilum]